MRRGTTWSGPAPCFPRPAPPSHTEFPHVQSGTAVTLTFALRTDERRRPVPTDAPAPASVPRAGRHRWVALLVVGAAMAVAAAHAAEVWPRYAVGSFDDDANYILTARALLAGQGLTGHLVSGDVVVGAYPPGFPLLLVPIQWAFHGSFTVMRLASVLSYLALLPLTWHYLGRRRMPTGIRVATVGLIALNPVLGTFSVMVMAEMPFLLCLLLLLVAVERWERSGRTLGPDAVAVAILASGIVWLKEAGVGVVAGLVLWLLVRRRYRRGVFVAVAMAATLLPVLVGRLAAGVPLLGSRYSSELGGYYGGGLLGRIVHVLPAAAWTWADTALPASVLPYGAPLSQTRDWHLVYFWLGLLVTALTVVGAVIAARRYRDVATVAVPVYVLETLFWPEVNERRVVLVLPLLLAWFALGSWWTAQRTTGLVRTAWAARCHRRPAGALSPVGRVALATGGLALIAAAVVVPLGRQLPRDYLFPYGVDSSHPQGSRYMELLRAAGSPSDVVETDYRYTTALETGHRTAWTATQVVQDVACTTGEITTSLAADDAAYLLLGSLNKYRTIDSPCLLWWAATNPTAAVRLLRTSTDQGSVFELIGPGTAHPDLVDRTLTATVTGSGGLVDVPVASSGAGDVPGDALSTGTTDGGRITWSWSRPQTLTQVSVGEAGLSQGQARGVDLQILLPDGVWETVAYSTTAVGDGKGNAPFLLATLPAHTRALAVRVAVRGDGPALALDVHALGPASTRR